MSAGALPADIVFHQAILYKFSYNAILNLEFQGRYSGGISTTPHFKVNSSGAVFQSRDRQAAGGGDL